MEHALRLLRAKKAPGTVFIATPDETGQYVAQRAVDGFREQGYWAESRASVGYTVAVGTLLRAPFPWPAEGLDAQDVLEGMAAVVRMANENPSRH